MNIDRLPQVVFGVVLAACCTVLGLREPEPARFRFERPRPGIGAEPSATRSELRAKTPAAHAATLARLPGGDVVAYWFAGTREGARDVQIFGARWSNGRWSEPESVLTVQSVMRDEWRFVRKLGNPVSVVDARGMLHLFFVSVSFGGWATSNLNQITSDDGGRSWGRARVLVTSPFFNLSTLARTTAVPREDGGFDLPVYHEGARKFPELLRFDANGHNFQKIRISAAHGLIQPAMIAQGERDAIALLRDSTDARRLRIARSSDGGSNWSAPEDANRINPDAAVALSQLSDGTMVLAYNPRTEGRSELALATSADGQHWTDRRTVEYEPGGEFSYPSLLVSADDEIHLVYTWQRKHIRHLRFNRAWLMAAPAEFRK